MTRWIAGAAMALLLAACGGSDEQATTDDPPALTALAVLEVPASAVAYDAGTLVLARSGEVTLWNASEPRAPRQVGRIEGQLSVGSITAVDQFGALALAGNVLALARLPACIGTCPPVVSRVELYDVARPEQPRLLAVIERPASALHLRDGRLYVLGPSDDLLAGSSAGALAIFDIATPAAPVLRSSTQVANAVTLEQRGDRLYLPFAEFAGSGSGLQVVDVADPAAPRVLATVGTPFSQAGAADAAADAGHAYWVNGSGSVRRFDLGTQVEGAPVLLDSPVSGAASDGTRLYLTGPAGIAVFGSPATDFVFETLVATPQPAASVSLFGDVGVVITEAVDVCTRPDPLAGASCARVAEPKVVLFKTPG